MATYNLGRVVKIGALTNEDIKDAIVNPGKLKTKNSIATFIDIECNNDTGYIFGYLAKYKPDGEVAIVEENKGAIARVDNQLIGACPFLYIPSEATLVYQYAPPLFPADHFCKVFSGLIEHKLNGVLVRCEIEPIADMENFLQRVASLVEVNSIKATVHPPNPLYGPCWKNLKDFLEKRNASTLKINEECKGNGLNTRVPQLSSIQESDIKESEPYEITDAAVMMSLDGYGEAVIKGKQGPDSKQLEFKTKDSQVSFEFDRKPDPDKLFEKAKKIIDTLKEKRKWKH